VLTSTGARIGDLHRRWLRDDPEYRAAYAANAEQFALEGNPEMIPPEPARSGLGNLLTAILGYMDRPWKAVVVILALILAGLGYAAWSERAAILAALRAPAGRRCSKPM
jgi:hypothetical protein